MLRRDRPVLVVEDDVDSRILLATLLTLHRYQVVTASNGRDALDRAREYQPCVILLDLMMPVMTGEEFRVAQRADPTISSIPVILVTAVHDARQKAHELGAVCCVPKPIDFEELLTSVAAHCDARARNDSPAGGSD